MNDCFLWIQATFTNREIATGIWILPVFFLCMFLKGVRNGMWKVLKTSMKRQVLILLGSLVANIIGLCWLLFWLGLWIPDQMSSTVLWFLLSESLLRVGYSLSKKTRTTSRNFYWIVLRLPELLSFWLWPILSACQSNSCLLLLWRSSVSCSFLLTSRKDTLLSRRSSIGSLLRLR